MRTTTSFLASLTVFALAAIANGCGSDDPLGSMGGQIFGDMASQQATKIATGNAQKQVDQQAAQQAAMQQQQQQQQAAAAAYKAPTMDMTGTLTETKNANGVSSWTFTQQGTTLSQPVDVTRVLKDVRALAGKNVTITGRYDTLGTGGFVVEKVAVAAQ